MHINDVGLDRSSLAYGMAGSGDTLTLTSERRRAATPLRWPAAVPMLLAALAPPVAALRRRQT
jgi:hypothetical protein